MVIPTIYLEDLMMAMNRVQLTSLQLLKSASAGLVDIGVSKPIRYGERVREGGVERALAERVCLFA